MDTIFVPRTNGLALKEAFLGFRIIAAADQAINILDGIEWDLHILGAS